MRNTARQWRKVESKNTNHHKIHDSENWTRTAEVVGSEREAFLARDALADPVEVDAVGDFGVGAG